MQIERQCQTIRVKRHISIGTRLHLLCLVALLKVGLCSAAISSWNGSVSQNWFVADNWTPVGVPASNDTINLTNSGTIDLTRSVTISGIFNWGGGTLSGSPMAVTSGGVLNIVSNNNYLYNVLTNAGTVTMSGNGGLYVANNNSTALGAIHNLSGALWDIQTNSSIYDDGYGYEYFDNAGDLRKSGGLGTSVIYVPFTNVNSGTVTNLTGTLSFEGGGPLIGGYDTALGATIDFAAGSFTVGVPPAITGAGLCEFTGATLTLKSNVPPGLVLADGNLVLGPAFQQNGEITNLTLSGPTLIGTNKVTGTMVLGGTTLPGPLTIESGGVLNIASNNNYLYNVLSNAGTVTMTGNGGLYVANNNSSVFGGIHNLSGALWDIQTNSSIYDDGYGYEYFNNAGELRKSGGSATAVIYVPYTNTGAANALLGTLSFNNTFTSAGGTLAFGVSSLSSFGKINVSGEVALNGTASVTWLDGYLPHVGNAFALLDYGSHSGTFTNIFLASGYLGQGNYSNTFFSVLITNKVTTTNSPFLSLQHGSDSTVVLSWPTSAGDFTLQTRTNLALGSWSNITSGITVLGTNNVYSNTVGGQAAFFRLLSP
jgi:hypothetical protein